MGVIVHFQWGIVGDRARGCCCQGSLPLPSVRSGVTVLGAAVTDFIATERFVGRNMDTAVGAFDHITGDAPWWFTPLCARFVQYAQDHTVEYPYDQADDDESNQVHGVPLNDELTALYRLAAASANHSAFAPGRALFHNRRPFFRRFPSNSG